MPDNEIIKADRLVHLPVQTKALMQGWRESPRKSYDSLPVVISHKEIFLSKSPTLRQISNGINENHAIMVISMAIEDVNRFFREDRRMCESDIVFVAKAILKRYWYLKPEDIKKCFMGPRPKSFVLEGDTILSWLAEYDLDRDRECESTPMEPEEVTPSENAVSFEDWCKSRPKEGNYLAYGRTGRPPLTKEEKERKDADFRKFKTDYLINKGIIPK